MSPHNILNILYRADDSNYVPSGFIVTQCASYTCFFWGMFCFESTWHHQCALPCPTPCPCTEVCRWENAVPATAGGDGSAACASGAPCHPCGENDDEPVDFGVLTQRLHHVLSCDSTSGKRTLCKMVSYRQLPDIWFHVDFKVSVCVRTSRWYMDTCYIIYGRPLISGALAEETGTHTKSPWTWSWQILSIKLIKNIRWQPQCHRCVWTILLLSEVAMRIMRINVVAPRKDISKHVPTIDTAFKKSSNMVL